MERKWMIEAKRADFQDIAKKFSVDPLVARLIRNRGIVGDDRILKYLSGGLDDLYDPALMNGISRAAELLLFKIRSGKKICIVGDYDADGIMSSHILKSALSRLGAQADVRIPDRMKDGYGINESIITEAAQNGADTILTCDNGISASDAVLAAKKLGLTVIITDHHEVPYDEAEDGSKLYHIPEADIVIDPKQADCTYPYPGLCGCGVAFKLICLMYDLAGIPESEKWDLLEFTAIATVADVMELTDENRIIVREGLKRLRETKNPGLAELISQNKFEKDKLSAYHIGFILGPCLNASGRLDTAMRALRLLETKDRAEAAGIAADLIALNASRKEMTRQGTDAAIEMVESSSLRDDKVLVVYLPGCHESIVGIIAGRLKEQYHKPSFVLTDSGDLVKGSGRSIEQYSMYEELCRCSEYLTKFGGHPMAAGLSLAREAVTPFRKRLNELCTLTEDDFCEKLLIDSVLPVGYITEELIRQISFLEPFGNGNRKPVFAQKGLRLRNPRVFGIDGHVVRMRAEDDTGTIDALYYGDGGSFVSFIGEHDEVTAAYYPQVNVYRGEKSLQIRISAVHGFE